ncbi:prepilin-type N-terminal cleavage/methylation domain-containing protein, partial [bacterium]|nr:prepilin-type N-terminal cleavage/methylation domain-containing protein [bacterium]MBU1025426.1 prepilin-type N-terminal cleavage/methylation domain-containing protein [bacterium]
MNFIRNKLNDDSGFTLIEMILVALMVLILATMALASMRRAREASMETAAQKALK